MPTPSIEIVFDIAGLLNFAVLIASVPALVKLVAGSRIELDVFGL